MSEQEQETLSDAERILNYHDWFTLDTAAADRAA